MKKKDKIYKKEVEKRFNNIILGGQKGMTVKVKKIRKSGNFLTIKYKMTIDLNADKCFAIIGNVIEELSNAEKRFKETKDYFEI